MQITDLLGSDFDSGEYGGSITLNKYSGFDLANMICWICSWIREANITLTSLRSADWNWGFKY